MRLVATRRLTPGARLGRDVPAANGGPIPLLRAGVALTTRHRDALLAAGIHGVYVDDELGAGIDVPVALREETREQARSALRQALSQAPGTLARGRPVSERTVADLEKVASLIAAEVAQSREAAVALADLAGADAYTLEHSIDVTVVGLLVGDRLFRERGRIDYRGQRAFDRIDVHLTQLGLGLMLHDIGKLAVPAHILNKSGRLDASEWRLVRGHPVAGLELLRGDSVGARAKSVVRSHHERWDGDGYPDGLAGEEISQFARIASVADVFDAVTSDRPYATAAAQHVGVSIVRSGAGNAFDPEVVDVFLDVVPAYPPGSELTLADGRRAVVVSVPAGRFDQPLVRVFRDEGGREVEPYELDLAGSPGLAPSGEPAGSG